MIGRYWYDMLIQVRARIIQTVIYCCELCKEIYFITFNVLLIELVCAEDQRSFRPFS